MLSDPSRPPFLSLFALPESPANDAILPSENWRNPLTWLDARIEGYSTLRTLGGLEKDAALK
jgi:hypothetical protein